MQETKCTDKNAPDDVIKAIDKDYPHRYYIG